MMEQNRRSPKDKYILFAFIGFFGVIFTVNIFFARTAIKTHPGVITENAYKKGLKYNETLKQVRTQPKLNDKVTFEDNILRWDLNDRSISNAIVTARIIRPIQNGYDFDIDLTHKGNGIYESSLGLPFKGLWKAKLESKWNNQTYKTTYQFILK